MQAEYIKNYLTLIYKLFAFSFIDIITVGFLFIIRSNY